MSWQPFPKEPRVFLILGATDLRKSFHTLSVIVDAIGLDVFSGDCFVFCNKRKNLVKCLYYMKNGFCIWLKRLDKHRFNWPQNTEDVRQIDTQKLSWLLEGFDIDKAHEKLHFSIVN